MKFAVDTGAFLSLASSLHFSCVLKEHVLITTKEVKVELLDFVKYQDFLGKKGSRVLEEIHTGKIIIEKARNMLCLKIDTPELSVFSLGKEKKYVIVTDDVHAARVAFQEITLQTKPSFFVLLQLYKKRKITKQELQHDLEMIVKKRNWMTGALYEYAKKLIEEI
jgi:predicted nucleic acid-binding protein